MSSSNCLTCRNRQTFGCSCQKPKCRVNQPAFATGGADCPKYTPKRLVQ